ncbi:MAG TPA: rhomboid family intramembrane serine protease [Anaerolineae bacterium]|nr:rhomboid family intramembrane serine protease [Anaerolineae bacterium]
MWVLEIIDFILFTFSLDRFGIAPRSLIGLRGIFLAPFLHIGFSHLISNTIPFLALGWLVMLRSLSDFVNVSIITAIISGLGVWLFASPQTVHLGASGLIFGYLGYLLLRGYFERSLVAIALALITTFFYGGILRGILPQSAGISWQAHLFGFIGGSIAAYLLTKYRPTE